MADETSAAQGTEQEITTPNKHVVKIKSFVTGRARAAIRGVMLGNMHITGKTGAEMGEEGNVNFTAAAMQEANLEAMRHLVISVDGDSNDAYNRVLDLHEDDYQAVYDAVDKIAKVSQLNEKKKAA